MPPDVTCYGTVGSYGGTATTANYVIWNQCVTAAATGSPYYGQITTATQTISFPYNSFDTPTVGTTATNFVYASFVAESEEQRLEREQRERDDQAKEASRTKRAREALLSVLTDVQRRQYETEKHFELQVNDRLYRVRPGCRVERLDPQSKQIQSYFCIHPALSHNLPSEDVALSQKLLLEANEKEFLRIANETKAGTVAPDYPREAAINEVMQALELAA